MSFIIDCTPLHLAAKNGHINVVIFLIENNAQIIVKDLIIKRPLLK